MSNYRISVPLPRLLPASTKISAGDFPALSATVRSIAEDAQAQWISYAQGAALPDGRSIKTRGDAYARSIQLRQTGDLSAQVYSALPEAQQIEEGTPQRDLKEMLGRSLKVRIVENPKSPNVGKRYLIIPFRWKAEGKGGAGAGIMPAAVAGWWRDKQHTTVRRQWTERKSGTGAWDIQTRAPLMVAQRRYRWGDRLTAADLDSLRIRGTGARKLMKGMVHFRSPGGKGGGAKSSFLTFRTMMEGSPGWIVPAKPGFYAARTVAQEMQREAEDRLRKAMEADLSTLLSRQG